MEIHELDEWQGVTPQLVTDWHSLAAVHGGNVQDLLRQINPRLRTGRPSEAARAARCGPWIGHMGGKFPLVVIGYWSDDGSSFAAGLMSWDAHKVAEAALAEYPCAFWPCDEHGNKVRWPTDAKGEML